jgi:hypothetical protein
VAAAGATKLRGGNNPETKFNIREKPAKEKRLITLSTAAEYRPAGPLRDRQEPTMSRNRLRSMGALLGILLTSVVAGQVEAKAVMSRSEQCNGLSHQLDEAIKTHARAPQVVRAKALQKKAHRFCASKRQAQGIRTLANGLKLLGVKPVDPGP